MPRQGPLEREHHTANVVAPGSRMGAATLQTKWGSPVQEVGGKVRGAVACHCRRAVLDEPCFWPQQRTGSPEEGGIGVGRRKPLPPTQPGTIAVWPFGAHPVGLPQHSARRWPLVFIFDPLARRGFGNSQSTAGQWDEESEV